MSIIFLHFVKFVFHTVNCLFVLKFYGPVNRMVSCRARSVYLTTRFLGRLTPLSVNQYCEHSFAKNWQLPHGQLITIMVLKLCTPTFQKNWHMESADPFKTDPDGGLIRVYTICHSTKYFANKFIKTKFKQEIPEGPHLLTWVSLSLSIF